jgi:coenzyme F420-reducing hydrogenase delta subunit
LSEHKVIGFTCRWSHKDLEERAGSLSEDGVRIFQLNCLANLTTSTLMNAFSEGADVVFLLGCGGPLCKYYEGWIKIDRVAKSLELMLQDMGLEAERLILSSCDEKSQDPLGHAAHEAVKRAKELGPSPYSSSRQ